MEQKEITLAELAKKIDDQSRFTRSLMIICTLIIVGFGIVALIETFNGIPSATVMQYMANLDSIVKEWDLAQASIARSKGTSGSTAGTSAAGK
jgi:hypothetical protein